MKSLFLGTVLLVTLCFPVFAQTTDSTVIFRETFEGADPLSAWTIAPNGGRVRIAQDTRDASNHGLLMDDADNDAVFKQNVVSKTVSIAGFANVVISVDIFSFNDEPNSATNAFDGVVVRAGGQAHYYPTSWAQEQHMELDLDPALADLANRGDGTITIDLCQYDNFSAPDDGLFFDNVTVSGQKNRKIIVESPLEISEADPLTLTVVISPPPINPVQLQLMANYSSHGTAIYPAGAAFAQLTFTNFDDDILQGSRQVPMTITDGSFYSDYFYPIILDNEFAGLTLSAPDTLLEGTSGNGVISLSASSGYFNVQLQSSDPTIAYVPPYVSVWGTSGMFPIVAVVDPRILPDREVTITATIGSEKVQSKIKITEGNSLSPKVTGPSILVEGSQNVPFGVGVNGISDQPLTINVSVDADFVSIEPATITLQPGQTQGNLKVSVADDNISQGDRVFHILVQGSSGQSQFACKVIDNEIAGFAIDLPDTLESDSSVSTLIHAVNENNTEVGAFSGTANVYLKDKTSGAEQLLNENVAFANGRATIVLNLPYSANGSRVVIRSPSGVSFTSRPLVIFRKLDFAANDLIWDSKRKVLYATSGGNAIPGHLHSLTPIDPATAGIGQPLFLGATPAKEVITDNAKYLYVGLSNGFSVQRIDLDSFTNVATISLSDVNGNYVPADLLAIPGRPLDFLALQTSGNSYYSMPHLYVNGVGHVLQNQYFQVYSLASSGASDEFYAFGYGSYFQVMRFKLSASDFTLITNQTFTTVGYYDVSVAAQNDLIFSSAGSVVDGRKMELKGAVDFPDAWNLVIGYPTPRIVAATDLSLSRVYYARGQSIAIFDSDIFQLIDNINIPAIGNISKIVRWGDAGIALLTDASEIVLLQDDRIVPTGIAADLSVTMEASPQPVFLGTNLTYKATVQNIGTNTARTVRLSFNLNGGQTVKAIDSGAFPVGYHGTNFFVDLGDMNPGDKHEVDVNVTPTILTTLVGSVAAVTGSLDSDYSNNHATAIVNVGFQSTPNSVNVVKLPINDMLPNPVTGELIVATTGNAPAGTANHILTLDPMTGLVAKSIVLPGEAGKLAVSDDGTALYAVNTARTTAFRVDLAAGQYLRTVSFNSPNDSSPVTDIKILHGSTDSILITGNYGVRIYDNGVPRTQTSGYYSGSYIALLPDPTLAIGVDYNGVYRYKLSASGVTVQTQIQSFLLNSFVKSDGIFVYGNDGKGVRADSMTPVNGLFDLSSAFGSAYYASAVEPDRARKRVFFAFGRALASFDRDTFLRVRKVDFNLTGNFATLERWGEDGFAARLDNGDLAIIRSDIVPDVASSIDLIVSIADGLQVDSPNLTIHGQAFHGQGIAGVKVGGQDATSEDAFANWVANVGPLAPGDNIITITATSLGNPVDTRTITRKVTYTPTADALMDPQWVTTHFGSAGASQSGASDDPDGDRQSNLAEFLFGTDPLVADKPQIQLEQDASGNVSVRLTRRTTPNFDFVVEVSSDFSSWQNAATQGTDSAIPGSANYVSSKFQMPAANGNQFYRVRAIQK